VVLLIYHDAQAVAEKHGGPRPHRVLGVQPGQLLAHEVALVQQQPVDRAHLVHPE
jgi:hypothetical protein